MSLLSYVAGLDRRELRDVGADLEAMVWPSVIPEEYQPVWWHGVNGVADEYTIERVYGLVDTIQDHIDAVNEEARRNREALRG